MSRLKTCGGQVPGNLIVWISDYVYVPNEAELLREFEYAALLHYQSKRNVLVGGACCGVDSQRVGARGRTHHGRRSCAAGAASTTAAASATRGEQDRGIPFV